MRPPLNYIKRTLAIGLVAGVFVAGHKAIAKETAESEDSLAIEANDTPSLPIPKHPGRQPENPKSSLPKASQPNREQRASVPVSMRTNGSLPVPGRPSRYLPEIGDDASAEAASQSEESAGILNFVPHSLYDGGITIECVYTGETFTKARGGLSNVRATNYRSNLDLVAIVDTQKMGWWDSGRFFIYGQNLSGKPLSASDVGDIQLFSNLDSTISDTARPHFTTIAEYWWEQLLFDEKLRVKAGKQDANADFALTDLGGEFVNSSFGLPPMIPLPTFPSQALGIAGFYSITDTIVFGAGVYDGTLPSGPQGVRWGFDTMGHNGAISLYQLELKPQLGPGGELPTTIRTGMWYHSDRDVWVEFNDVPAPRTFRNNYGCWTTADQMLWKEEFGSDNDQGLGMFFQFGWAPSNRNVIQEYYGGGFVYKGLLPNRDDDFVGVGFANAMLSGRYRAASALLGDVVGPSETAVEVFLQSRHSPTHDHST